jgi:hypothetical protein
MFVIRLASGNLLVPDYAMGEDGRVLANAYVEIGPDHPDYARLFDGAISEQEAAERRRRWQDGDEALREQFVDYLARYGSEGGWHDEPA